MRRRIERRLGTGRHGAAMPVYRVYQHVLEHWRQVVRVELSIAQAVGVSMSASRSLVHLEADITRVLDGPRMQPIDTGPWDGVKP